MSLVGYEVKCLNEKFTRCAYGPWIDPSICAWSDYINNYDQENFKYECGTNQVVTGFESVHSNRREDRRRKVRCCGVSILRSFLNHGKPTKMT